MKKLMGDILETLYIVFLPIYALLAVVALLLFLVIDSRFGLDHSATKYPSLKESEKSHPEVMRWSARKEQ